MPDSNANAPDETSARLDERKASVLRAIVEGYVREAQPVGSQVIAQQADLGVSSATVRNDMAVLEREGYIAQPHTSAGRVPTDKGYRYYVDHFTGQGTLAPPQRREVQEFFTSSARVMDDLLLETSRLLARLTAHAAVVVGPQPDTARVRSVTLVELQPGVMLAIVVMSNGAIERQAFTLDTASWGDAPLDDAVVAEAGQRLTRHLAGSSLGDAAPLPSQAAATDAAPSSAASEGRAGELAALAFAALCDHASQPGAEPVFVGGASRLVAERAAFPSTQAADQVLALLEQHAVVVGIMRELLGPGLVVRIGAENERAEMRECSLILAPYLIEGEPLGTVGVLGPTRMDYRHARAAVQTVSQLLGRTLS